MSRPLALYTDVVDIDPGPGISELRNAGWDVEVVGSADPEVIAAFGAEAVALLIGYSRVTEELLGAMPKLRVVATQSVGYDMVDLAACAQRGIAVSNVPASATEEVSVHALALALALLRGITDFDRSTKLGEWDLAAASGLARPSTLTLGVLGLGRIGGRLAALGAPIFGRVIGYDPAEFDTPGVERAGLEQVLRSAHVLSLHLPLTPDTRLLLNRERIAMLPRGARVVNVARGALIDEQALIEALDSGRIAGAGLDVLTLEPPAADDRLLLHPRVIATPHAAFLSPESEKDYVLHQAANVVEFGRSGKLLTPVT